MKRILVIDDQKFAAEVIRFYCRNRYDVDYASNPKIGLERLAEREYDLVVLDYKMPIMNGCEFLLQYKQEYSAPVVLCSSSEPDKGKFVQAGTAAFLDKPFKLEDLEQVFETWLEKGTS